ncbi:MAG: hypothetical protein ACK5Q5_04440 [Planctomycetaceae bacterium]
MPPDSHGHRIDLMDRTDLPQLSRFDLHRSLSAAEAIEQRALQTSSPDLRRVLLKSSCDLLDHALRCSLGGPLRRRR